jgi:hypothetical protein
MRRTAALIGLIFLAACSSEIEQSTRPDTVAGTYDLRTYGGRALPALVATDSSGVLEIVSAQLQIGSDKSWSEAEVYRLTKGTKMTSTTFNTSGSWVFYRDYAFMVFNDKVYGYEFTGTVAGRSVQLDLQNGNSMVYARQ